MPKGLCMYSKVMIDTWALLPHPSHNLPLPSFSGFCPSAPGLRALTSLTKYRCQIPGIYQQHCYQSIMILEWNNDHFYSSHHIDCKIFNPEMQERQISSTGLPSKPSHSFNQLNYHLHFTQTTAVLCTQRLSLSEGLHVF